MWSKKWRTASDVVMVADSVNFTDVSIISSVRDSKDKLWTVE